MKKYFFYFALIIFLFGAQHEIFAQGNLRAAINQHIAKQEKAESASVPKESIKILSGDLDGDGDKDAAVHYVIEGFGGGNSFGQILAVFVNNKGVYKFAAEETVGGKFFDYTSGLASVGKGVINLNTETCAEPPQGICENPKEGKAKFYFKQGKLVKG